MMYLYYFQMHNKCHKTYESTNWNERKFNEILKLGIVLIQIYKGSIMAHMFAYRTKCCCGIFFIVVARKNIGLLFSFRVSLCYIILFQNNLPCAIQSFGYWLSMRTIFLSHVIVLVTLIITSNKIKRKISTYIKSLVTI